MLTLFLFGTLWFWGLLALASLCIIWALEDDNVGGATVAFLVTLAAVFFLGNSSWLTWIMGNPLRIGLLVGTYLLIGVGWGISKWWIYLHDASARNRAERMDWLQRRLEILRPNADNVEKYEAALEQGYVFRLWPLKVKTDWERYVKVEYYGKVIKKPMVSANKSCITGWMTYWPWSVLWTIINDPVRRFYKWAYTHLRGLLQGMSDKAFKDLDE